MSNGVSMGTAYNQDGAIESTHAKKDETAEALANKRSVDIHKLQHIKLGNTVTYTKGIGTIVAKEGMYVTVYNSTADKYDTVHVGETYIPGDAISMGAMNTYWDNMALGVHEQLLRKANVKDVNIYSNRMWHELPLNLREIIQNVAKSDVEHGAYGGVVTDTPFDAPEDYEEDSREGKRAQNQHNHQQKEPRNLKEESCSINIGFMKSETTIKGTPDEVEKEGGGSGTSNGSASTSTSGAFNAVYNDEKKIRNKFNTRYGPRQVTKEEAIEFLNKQHLNTNSE